MWPSIRRKVMPYCARMTKETDKNASKPKPKACNLSTRRESSSSLSSDDRPLRKPSDVAAKKSTSAERTIPERALDRIRSTTRAQRRQYLAATRAPSNSKSSKDTKESKVEVIDLSQDVDEEAVTPIVKIEIATPPIESVSRTSQAESKDSGQKPLLTKFDEDDDEVVTRATVDKSDAAKERTTVVVQSEENSRDDIDDHMSTDAAAAVLKSGAANQQQDSDSCGASVTSADGRLASGSSNRGRGYLRINFRAGEKIEARDCFNMWYPSKIIQVDWDDKEVLIHFERWNHRFDEWVSMNSPRLRAATRTSSRKEKGHHRHRGFRIGQVILAKWSDCKMYPGKILKILPDNSYNVRFYDGFERIVQPINVKKLPSDMVGQINFKCPPAPLAAVLQQSGDKKRNLSGGSKSVESKNRTVEIKTKMVSDKGKSMSAEKTKATAPQDKTEPSTTKVKIAAAAAPDKPEATKISKIIVSSTKSSGTSKTKSKSKTPPTLVGNQKNVGSGGGSAGGSSSKKRKLVVGGIFQAKRYKVEPISTSAKQTTAPTMTPSRPKTVKPVENVRRDLLPSTEQTASKKKGDETTEASVKPSSVVTPLAPAVTNDAPLPVTVPSKAFVIEEDHNHFKCPTEGCGKAFRKESLLSSHLKHYHRSESQTSGTPANHSRSTGDGPKQVVKTVEEPEVPPVVPVQKEESPVKQQMPVMTEGMQVYRPTTPVKQKPVAAIKEPSPVKQPQVKAPSPVKTTSPIKPPSPVKQPKPSPKDEAPKEEVQAIAKPEVNMDRKKITEKRRQLLLQRRLEGIYKKRQQQALIEKSRLAMLEKSRQQRRARQARICDEPQNPSPSHDTGDDNPAQLLVEAVYEESKAEESIELKIGSVKKRILAETVIKGPAETPVVKSESQSESSSVKRSKRKRNSDARSTAAAGTATTPTTATVKPEVTAESKLPVSPKRSKRIKRAPDDATIDDESTTSATSDIGGAYSETVEDKRMLERLTREFSQFTKSRQSFRKARDARGRGEINREEVVNCRCENQEEEGLMMQCEVCLAWQHGSCFGIEDEKRVPEKYVCFACEAPRGQRPSFRYRHHQDWFKRGSMATFAFLPKREDDWELKGNMLRTHNLASQMFAVNQVLHSLRRKLQVVKDQDPSDLEFWSSPWIDTTPEFTPEVGPTVPAKPTPHETPPADENFNFSDHSYSSVTNRTLSESAPALLDARIEEPEIEGIQVTVSTSCTPPPQLQPQQIQPQQEQQPATKMNAIEESLEATTTPPTTSSAPSLPPKVDDSKDSEMPTDKQDESTKHPMPVTNGIEVPEAEIVGNVPVSEQADIEIVQVGSMASVTNNEVVVESAPVVSVEPLDKLRASVTKEFDVYECQLNVLDHIEQLQEELDKRMDELSDQLEELESYYEQPLPIPTLPNNSSSVADLCSPDMLRSKRLLKGMMTDLNKVRRMSLYC